MGKYKLLAIDLDDTLLDDGFKIPEGSRRALLEAREAGVRVTLATGRMFRAALPYAREIGLDGYLITYQGALVKHAVSGETLFHRPVPLESAIDVVEQVRPYGYHINLYFDDKLYVAEHTKESEQYSKMSGAPVEAVGDLTTYLNQRRRDPTKVLVVARPEQIDQLLAEMRPAFQDKLHVTKSKPHFLEFSHPLANKGDALSAIAAHYGVKQGEIIAVGDGHNDLEMIDYAGLGVVVDNGRSEIKARANYVCRSNEECGVAEVVEKFILG